MATVNNPGLAEKVRIRILEIMESTGLEIVGLAQAINISTSHLRSLLNKTKPITGEVADLMGEFIGLDAGYFFTFDRKLPSDIRTRDFVARFRSRYANCPEYFTDTRYDRDDNYLIEVEIYNGNFFNSPRNVGEVVELSTLETIIRKFTRVKELLRY